MYVHPREFRVIDDGSNRYLIEPGEPVPAGFTQLYHDEFGLRMYNSHGKLYQEFKKLRLYEVTNK